jgi:hypothetical protein
MITLRWILWAGACDGLDRVQWQVVANVAMNNLMLLHHHCVVFICYNRLENNQSSHNEINFGTYQFIPHLYTFYPCRTIFGRNEQYKWQSLMLYSIELSCCPIVTCLMVGVHLQPHTVHADALGCFIVCCEF